MDSSSFRWWKQNYLYYIRFIFLFFFITNNFVNENSFKYKLTLSRKSKLEVISGLERPLQKALTDVQLMI